MSNALVPMQDLDRWADAFARSGMFGAKNKEQALSLLLLAQAEGMHPAIAMRDFDIIQGRPAKKAEAMHRSFISAGGKIEWHALSDDLADATFSHPQGGTVRITWDIARARKAGLGSKDMYSKYPRQMLKARCISEGCRTVYPAATSGLYVPDEVVTFAKPAEKHMGKADIVEDEDITQQIPGVGKDARPVSAPQAAEPPPSSSSDASAVADPSMKITQEQAGTLRTMCDTCDQYAEEKFREIAKIAKLEDLPAADYAEAVDWIHRRAKRLGGKAA